MKLNVGTPILQSKVVAPCKYGGQSAVGRDLVKLNLTVRVNISTC